MRELVGQGKPFYSALDKAAGLLRRKVGTGSEFLKELMSIPGVKQAEIAERGLGELLNAPKMTHEQFMAALGAKPAPAIHEKVFGEKPALPSKEVLRRNANDLIRVRAREYASEGSDTSAEYRRLAAEEMQRLRSNHMDQALRLAEESAPKNPSPTYHGGYTLPGGDNYREMLIKAPKQPDYMNQIETAHNELRNMPYHGRTPEQEKRVGQLAKLIREIEAKTKELPEQFHGVGAHFGGEPGILASMRLKDRTGPNGEKLLHLEELQSDWHQQGRERGYGADWQVAKDEGGKFIVLRNGRKVGGDGFDNESMAQRALEVGQRNDNVIPDAPFKKNWEEMALKRLIHHAAENGYHGVVVTPGAEQADRYGLAKHVGMVSYHPGEKRFQAFKPNRETVVNEKDASPDRVAELIGKEAAQRLLAAPKVGDHHFLEGEDLNIGGEGMKGFYDKKVPNILNSIGKKYGVKTELGGHTIQGRGKERTEEEFRQALMDAGHRTNPLTLAQQRELDYEPKPTPLHYFPITEEMRQDVKKNGIPLYKSGGSVPTH